ncbi:hypothetical protein [Streptomyces flavalbus]|uniref:Uncharacterized protein n=1 Tax=Streptomyces flavalbus TaxID=2665155 RepID=A0ABW2W830_9ACTN
MASLRGRLEYSDELTPGQTKDGGLHQNLYDSQGRLVGHATFIPDDENEADSPERSELDKLLGALVLLGAIKAAEKAAPHLKRWWNDQALPYMKSARIRLAQARKSDSQAAPTASTTLTESAPAQTPQEVAAIGEDYRASMSSTEAWERFVAALMARLFSEEQMRILRNVQIKDENDPLELSAVGALTPQLGDSIRLMLETNPSLLDEETLAELGRVLARHRTDGGVLLRNEQINASV